MDYLLKPVNPDELKKALEKYHHFHATKTAGENISRAMQELQPKKKERFLVRIGMRYHSIPASEIICFCIEERNCFLREKSGKYYPLEYSLDKIEQMVDPRAFFRVNRNFIIHFGAIRDIHIYSGNRLKIILSHSAGEEEILVSRDRVGTFKDWMDR